MRTPSAGGRRPSLRLSGLGTGLVVVAVLLGGAGWWLGWEELTVPAVGVAAALPAAVLLTAGRSAFAVDVELSQRRVTAGTRAVGRLAVRNTSGRRLLPARVELPVGHGSADVDLPSLAGGATHEEVFAVPTTRRGVVVVGPVRSVRGDPLGLVRRSLRWTDPVDLYVHPRLVGLTGAAAGVLRDLEGQATRVVSDADLSFHALRDYVPGDDRRHIHWRTTARTGALVVRQFEDTRRTRTAVALSTATGDYADEEQFELAVSVAASVGVQTLRDEGDLIFLAGDRSLRTRRPAQLLDDTATLTLSPTAGGSTALPAWVQRDAADASVAVLVTGSVPGRSELRALASRLGVRTVVLTCGPGQVTTHGAVSVAGVATLTDLPTVLRRVVTG